MSMREGREEKKERETASRWMRSKREEERKYEDLGDLNTQLRPN